MELMPIGNRLAAGGEALAAEEPAQTVGQALQPAQEQPVSLAQEMAASGQMPPLQMAPPPQGENAAEDDSAVTEEELEALLKEFLTT